MAPGLAPAAGYREESYYIRSFPYQSREVSGAPGGTWMLELAGGNRDKVRDTQRCYTFTGTVDASTREIQVPGNIWRKEWAVSDPDSDSLQSGWKFELCEKPCAY